MKKNPPKINNSSKWHYPLRWLVIIVLGLMIYAQAFGFNFVFDDISFIVANPYIKSFDQIHNLWKFYPQTRAIGFYSFAFNYYINQLNPAGYHIFNFIIHLIAVGLIWALSGLLFKLAGWVPSNDKVRSEIPFIIAVLYLVHPCQTQAVTYIAQRFESMATLFYLGSIYTYLRGRLSTVNLNKALFFMASLVFALLGLYTKEVAVTIPVMILALEFIFFTKETFWKVLIVLAIVGFLFFWKFMKLVRTDLNIFFHLHPFPSESHDGDMITAKGYLLTQMRVFLTFMRLLVLPIHQTLEYDYPLSTGLLSPPNTLLGLCLILTTIGAIFKTRKEYPIIAFGLAWILITFSINLAPRSNVIFEHKLYLISFGFFLVLVNILFNVIRDKTQLITILIAIVSILSFISFHRNQVWQNDLTLWSDTVEKSPHKARPLNNLGKAYFDLGNFTQAIADYDKTIEINPKHPDAYYNRGLVYFTQGDDTKAMTDFNKAIELNPVYSEAYNNRGQIYERQGQIQKALLDFNKAIETNLYNAKPYNNRGIIYAKRLRYDLAVIDFNKAIEIEPLNPQAYNNRAFAEFFLKQYDRSWEDVRKLRSLGAKIDPHFLNDLIKASGQNN